MEWEDWACRAWLEDFLIEKLDIQNSYAVELAGRYCNNGATMYLFTEEQWEIVLGREGEDVKEIARALRRALFLVPNEEQGRCRWA